MDVELSTRPILVPLTFVEGRASFAIVGLPAGEYLVSLDQEIAGM